MLSNGGKESTLTGTESSSSIYDTTKNGAAAVVQIGAELEVDVRHDPLDGDWEHRVVNTGVEGLCIVKEHNGFDVTTTSSAGALCRGSHQCGASHTGERQCVQTWWGNLRLGYECDLDPQHQNC
jgi:hypothetical protein